MKPLYALPLLATLAACSPPPKTDTKAEAPAPAAASAPQAAAAPADAPAGEYFLDPAHTSVTFRVSHLGLSNYTARFAKVGGALTFDPANPAAQKVSATIPTSSLRTDYPDPKTLDFDAKVAKEFLGAPTHPTITFVSSRVEPTGPRTARVVGDLTLNGVTKPVTLEATFNGGYKAGGMDPSGARVGFSARTSLRRSDFGVTYGLPAPGTTMGVGDDIEVLIESEATSKPPA
jgi:polyisoprenoid-binding protein YceI